MTKLANFDNEVRMWVYEEMINGRKLTEIINSEVALMLTIPITLLS